MTVPTKFSGMSMVRISDGSMSWPSTRLVTMVGRETRSSKPSRRIISMRTESWSSPRPSTLKVSAVSVGFHADGDVGEELALEAVLDVAGGDELAFAAGEGGVVDREVDGDGGLVDGDDGQRLGVLERAEALADGDAGDAGDGDDVADGGLVGVFALEAVEGEELGDLDGLERAVDLGQVDGLAGLEGAVEDARDG